MLAYERFSVSNWVFDAPVGIRRRAIGYWQLEIGNLYRFSTNATLADFAYVNFAATMRALPGSAM